MLVTQSDLNDICIVPNVYIIINGIEDDGTIKSLQAELPIFISEDKAGCLTLCNGIVDLPIFNSSVFVVAVDFLSAFTFNPVFS